MNPERVAPSNFGDTNVVPPRGMFIEVDLADVVAAAIHVVDVDAVHDRVDVRDGAKELGYNHGAVTVRVDGTRRREAGRRENEQYGSKSESRHDSSFLVSERAKIAPQSTRIVSIVR
jgi:hypothetical protein